MWLNNIKTSTLLSFSFPVQKFHTLRFLLPVCFALFTSACTVSPLDGRVLSNTDASVPVVGFWAQPSTPLHIVASPSPEGPWTILKTVNSETSPRYYGDRRLYPFNARVRIPSDLWQIPPSDCASYETYIGISTRSATPKPGLISLEDESLSGENPFVCLDDNGYDASKCAGRRSPLARLLVGNQITRHVGDITIRNEADYNLHRCHDTIVGNLRVENTVGEITLPELRDVAGDVELEHPVEMDPAGPHRGIAVPRHLPQLTRIEGNLHAIARGEPSPGPGFPLYSQRRMELDIPLLQRVGGDVELLNIGPNGERVTNGYFYGLDELTYIGGDVRLSNHPDRYFGILNKVRRVDGTVYLGGGKPNGRILYNLHTIGGDLEIPATRIKPGVLANLKTIEGDARLSFHWVRDDSGSERNLESLERVEGTLALINAPARNAFALGALPVSVGSLMVENNNNLADILPGEVEVRDTGEVRFSNNPQLCHSRIQTFLSALIGWTGISTVLNNGDC